MPLLARDCEGLLRFYIKAIRHCDGKVSLRKEYHWSLISASRGVCKHVGCASAGSHVVWRSSVPSSNAVLVYRRAVDLGGIFGSRSIRYM